LPNGEHLSNGVTRADTNTASQIANLSEALDVAKQELETQSNRLKEMEDLLVIERVRRQEAEARAKRLEKEQAESGSIKVQIPNGTQLKGDEDHTTPIEDEVSSEIGKRNNDGSATQKLHQRLDLLLAEFQEVKASAERWKQEKEVAEKERDEEKKEKLGLMERITELRREQQASSEKETKKRGKKALRGVADEEDRSASTDSSSPTNSAPRSLFTNGHLSGPLLHADSKDGGTFFASHTGQMVQAAPYISAVSVVLIGVAVMALVNKMSRGEH
jgi:hypothetical protein